MEVLVKVLVVIKVVVLVMEIILIFNQILTKIPILKDSFTIHFNHFYQKLNAQIISFIPYSKLLLSHCFNLLF